jgi:hypothetical protein
MVVTDTMLLIYGLYLLRRSHAAVTLPRPEPELDRAVPAAR